MKGALGRCFAIYHAPVPESRTWGNVLCVPAFNEEMNRCRSMLTLLAQALAEIGVGTLMVDLHGTGESDGGYGDARWDAWKTDVGLAMDWLDSSQRGGCVALLGVRLGAPLAAEVLNERPGRRTGLVVWQPVVDGKSHFTQFLRIRVAANMDRTDIAKEGVADMRKQLAAGQSVEVAGYEVGPQLAAAIEGVRLAERVPPDGCPIAWFEKGAAVDGSLSAASQAVVDAWLAAGRELTVGSFDGPTFWSVYHRAVAPDLIRRTVEWLASLREKT
jgi:exosortase A-associated hydrolase 2